MDGGGGAASPRPTLTGVGWIRATTAANPAGNDARTCDVGMATAATANGQLWSGIFAGCAGISWSAIDIMVVAPMPSQTVMRKPSPSLTGIQPAGRPRWRSSAQAISAAIISRTVVGPDRNAPSIGALLRGPRREASAKCSRDTAVAQRTMRKMRLSRANSAVVLSTKWNCGPFSQSVSSVRTTELAKPSRALSPAGLRRLPSNSMSVV